MGFLFALVFSFAVHASHSQVDFNPKVDVSKLPKECQDFINTALPQHHWAGGFVGVPEDWNDPQSPQILIFYYYNNSPDYQSRQPIVFLNGGPFTSYHIRMDALSKQLVGDPQNTFVMMDQRGTGCSIPNIPEQQKIDYIRFAKYGSPAIARDAEIIRQKLFGERSWKIFAQSYGGFLGLRYLELFPSHVMEMHLYGPVLHESMSEFFWRRIVKQNEVLRKFLQYYQADNLERAFAILSGPVANKYCVFGGAEGAQICGRALADAIVAVIGQGRGRGLESTEVWNGVRNALSSLIASNPDDPQEQNHKAFLSAAKGALAFFHDPSSAVVKALWAQEFPFVDGDSSHDCDDAYSVLRNQGVDVAGLPLDECRIIKQASRPDWSAELVRLYPQVRGGDFLTQDRILELLRVNPRVRLFMYSGALDSLAQTDSLAKFSQSPLVNFTEFSGSGHAGWLYEPLVWQQLLEVRP